jgi:hypothetical protein
MSGADAGRAFAAWPLVGCAALRRLLGTVAVGSFFVAGAVAVWPLAATAAGRDEAVVKVLALATVIAALGKPARLSEWARVVTTGAGPARSAAVFDAGVTRSPPQAQISTTQVAVSTLVRAQRAAACRPVPRRDSLCAHPARHEPSDDTDRVRGG